MQKPLERDWELSIGPDTVRMIAEKARAISAAVNEDYADGAEHEVELVDQAKDNHHHDGLAEEKEDDLRTEELRELIQDLNVDEAADLIALMSANGRSEALIEAERATAADQGRIQRERFLIPGSGYQPGNARMFGNGSN